jgi:hypothetical protein
MVGQRISIVVSAAYRPFRDLDGRQVSGSGSIASYRENTETPFPIYYISHEPFLPDSTISTTSANASISSEQSIYPSTLGARS